MLEQTTTPYSNQASILATLWMNHRGDEQFKDFIEYNDLGLPLAYIISENIVKSTDLAQKFIEETFDVLLAGLEIEDVGFDTLDDLLVFAEVKDE